MADLRSDVKELPRVADLRAVAALLSGDPRYRRLVTDIDRAVRVQSCAADLKQAHSICRAWKKLSNTRRGEGSDERQGTETALLFAGVSLYVRATWSSTKKGDRGSVNIESKLKPDELIDHQAVVDVRNQAFAHVYPERLIAGDVWNDVACIMVEQEEGWLIGAANRSTFHHAPIWDALLRQVPVAISILEERYMKRVNAIAADMSRVGLPAAAVEQSLIDPVQLFGSVESAWRMMPGGSGRSVVGRTKFGSEG